MVSKKRGDGGKFINSSPYGKKNLGIRLLKDDEVKLVKIAEQKGTTPTELGRVAIAEWLKQND